ncbi:hypothetical protein [Phormidesmis priestleyi]|uniref:hypothetical protein n=1 Tax=Phormidesmis priestleyi TaxID=268141 RepID=UPI00083AC8D9|nr:hypothetical protein [Phormidesmis priestleyi]
MMSNDAAPGIQQELKQIAQATFELSEKIDTLTDGIRDMREGIVDLKETIAAGFERTSLKLDRLADLTTNGFQDVKEESRRQNETARMQAESVSRLIAMIEAKERDPSERR